MVTIFSRWLPIVVLIVFATFSEIESRVVLNEKPITGIDKYKTGSISSKDAVETAVEETSALLSQLRNSGYDDDVEQKICLELKYLDFSSIQVSAKCVKLYRQPNCTGEVSDDENAIVSIGKNKLSSCAPQNRHATEKLATAPQTSPMRIVEESEISIINPYVFEPELTTLSAGRDKDEAYDLEDFPEKGEHEPWKSTTESQQKVEPEPRKKVTAMVLIESSTTSSEDKSSETFSEEPSTVENNNSRMAQHKMADGNLPCERKCAATDAYGAHWEVCLGGTGFRECPGDAQGSVVWQCGAQGHFVQPHPTYSECHSNWISEAEISILKNPTQRTDDRVKTTQLVLNHTNRSNSGTSSARPRYFGHEIPGILTLVERVNQAMDTDGLEAVESLVSSSVVILDTVASEPTTWKQLSVEDRAAAGTKLITTLESTMFRLAKTGKQSGITNYEKSFVHSQNIAVRVGSLPRSSLSSSDQLEIVGQNPMDPVIKLPEGWTAQVSPDDADEEIHFVQMSMTAQCVDNIIPKDENGNAESKRVNSKLATFSVSNKDGSAPAKMNFKDKGILITFPHEAYGTDGPVDIPRRLHDGEDSTVVLGSAVCVYWDTTALKWSSEGCRLVESGKTHSTCECMHLSSFAVLMDAHQYVGKDTGIIVLTRLLCTVSCLCLLATIIVFKRLHSVRNPRSSVTIHLSFCLLLGNLLILTLMDRDNFPLPNGLCAFVGMFTHFVFLSAFAWMGIEGFIVYKMVVDVFESGTENKIKLRLLAYGAPLAIVLTFLIIHVSTDGSTYGGELYCWLQGNYIWSFILPVMLICVVNLFVLIVALQTAFRKKNPTPKQAAKQTRTMVVGTLSLTCLLGITWIFGFLLTINNYTAAIIGAYIFTILNASQGIFIFIFHCWMNKQVRVVLTRRVTAWHSTFVSTDNTKVGKNDAKRRSEPSIGLTDGSAEQSNTTMSTSVKNSQIGEKTVMLSSEIKKSDPPSETQL